jgi:hypothetical protein
VALGRGLGRGTRRILESSRRLRGTGRGGSTRIATATGGFVAWPSGVLTKQRDKILLLDTGVISNTKRNEALL